MDCAPRPRVTAVEFWLRDQVASAQDALKAEPSSAFSVADVRATLAADLKKLRQAVTDTVRINKWGLAILDDDHLTL